MEFSRPEYWSGQNFPSAGGLPNPGNEPRSPALQAVLYQLSHKGSPRILEWVAFPFSRGSSQPRDPAQVSCTAGSSLPAEPQGKLKNNGVVSLFLHQRIFPTQKWNWGLLHS